MLLLNKYKFGRVLKGKQALEELTDLPSKEQAFSSSVPPKTMTRLESTWQTECSPLLPANFPVSFDDPCQRTTAQGHLFQTSSCSHSSGTFRKNAPFATARFEESSPPKKRTSLCLGKYVSECPYRADGIWSSILVSIKLSCRTDAVRLALAITTIP